MNMLKIITRSGICLHAPWAHAYRIAQLADRLPAHMRPQAVPFTVQPQLEAACRRAFHVLSFNSSRRSLP